MDIQSRFELAVTLLEQLGYETCPHCDGTATVDVRDGLFSGGTIIPQPCDQCVGTGYIETKEK